MTDYSVKYTDVNTSPITVQEADIDDTSLDVVLFGRVKQEYGEELNENLVSILEKFACPEDTTVGTAASRLFSPTPDYTTAVGTRLENPTVGQIWYNSTQKHFYVWTSVFWKPIFNRADIAANWGYINDGNQLPRPVSDVTGHIFEYSECIWSIAPRSYAIPFNRMECRTDDTANVTMKYRVLGSSETDRGSADFVAGNVNYLIIGIRGNVNYGYGHGEDPTVTPTPTPTPNEVITPSGPPSS